LHHGCLLERGAALLFFSKGCEALFLLASLSLPERRFCAVFLLLCLARARRGGDVISYLSIRYDTISHHMAPLFLLFLIPLCVTCSTEASSFYHIDRGSAVRCLYGGGLVLRWGRRKMVWGNSSCFFFLV
jgi:hypothetical protein